MRARFIGRHKCSELERTDRQIAPALSRGFTLLELIVVVAIVMILAAIALPNFIGSMGSANLRGGLSSLSGLVNAARSRAIKQNATVRLRFTNVEASGRWVAYVDDDFYNTYLTSTDLTNTMQQVWLPKQMVKVPAPTGTSPAPLTASAMWGGTDTTPPNSSEICFNSRGVPCTCPSTSTAICTAITNGYAYYFNYQTPSTWGAVGVSPAGRIKTYLWTGAAWAN